MSFNSIKKPRLVESKLVNYYNNKNKIIENKEVIEKTDLSNKWYKKLLDNTILFVKNNYGFVVLSLSIIILLYIRYIEVNRRKNKIKELYNNSNDDNNDDIFFNI